MKISKNALNTTRPSTPTIETFKPPILTTIYRISGVMVLVLGGITAVITMLGGALLGSANDHSGVPAVVIALVIMGVAIAIALPLFGIAQVVEYIGKTAFYSEIITKSLSLYHSDVCRDMSKVVARLDGLAGQKPAQVTSEASSYVRCPQCNKPISTDSLTKGLNECPHCQGQFKAE